MLRLEVFCMRLRIGVLLAVVVSFLTFPAQAQYFGQNKVQWENFKFKTLRTEHFDIYYYETEADVVNDIGRMAERWYARLSRSFNHSFNRKPIVLYANPADFHQTTTTGGPLGEGTGGFTDAFMNRVVLPLTGDYSENDHVLGHEIVHVFQYDIAAAASKNQRRFNLNQLPLWLVEGMAEYFSKGRVDPLTSMWIRDATINDRLPDLRDLSRDPRYFPYRYGQALMAYIGARFGDDAVVRYFRSAGVVGVEEAFERAVGLNAKQLFADWQESSRELYNPIVQARAATLAQPLIGRKPEPGKKRSRRMTEMNVGPALSPDGRHIAFLSARELFSIDLFLADAKTGKIIRRLVSGDRDAHFESLRFIESAGAWSPDGRRLAFVTFAKGDNYLGIVDVETRNVDSISVPGIDAIHNVAWSPDGKTIVIAGQMTGVSDLFLFDLDTKDVRRLTNDKFADFQPAFSPDGRSVVFATDRASSDMSKLDFGELGLAIVDVSTGVVRDLNLFANARHLNPQWSPDGGSIYFIANPEGVPDIYRFNRADTTVVRVTSVQTGVSGITDTAPALTVAARSGDIAFSLFEGDNYNIYTLPANAPAQTASLNTLTGIPRAAILPPLRAAGSEITTYLNSPEQGLPPQGAAFEQRPYNADLHLAYLGPPTIGASVGGGYNAVGGTVSAYFSDILGQHNVGVTFQGSSYATSSIADQLAGEVFYLNQQHRWNWGADAVHIPYITPFYDFQQNVPIEIDGEEFLADVYSEIRQIQTFTNVSGITQYPFSTTRRIEASAGYLRYALKEESEDWYVIGGTVVDRRVVELPGSFAFNWYTASTAFVGDSSTFGFVSPIRGTRYRYEVEALTGDLRHTTALADWRRYFYRRPATLAVRALHYGRYGAQAEDGRLRPLFLGSGSLVRAYEPWTIDPSECGNTNICDRLLGSRILAGSVELRAPLLGTPEFGLINASFLPTEIFAFGDVGVAWSKGQEISWKFDTNSTEHTPVFSAGIGLRILLSYIPIEIYAARPFQRPNEDVVYGFNITPGW
jgi:Tol biopolymer transport system component